MVRPTTMWLLILLVLALLGTAAALWWNRGADSSLAAITEGPRRPGTGFWHYLPETSEESRRSDEMARILSLPYVSGSEPATGDSGIIVHSAEHAQPGVNFYVSGHSTEAILLSMEGEVLHRWRLDTEAAFGEARDGEGSYYFRRAQLLPGGELLVLLQGEGIVKLDARSRPLWALDLGAYNDLEVLPDGTIYTLGKEAREILELGREGPVLEDSVVVLSPEGELLRRISLLQAFRETPYESLMTPLGPKADIFHSNTVTYLDGSLAHLSELFAEGNLLVSLREIDTIAILDPRQERIVWAARGPWVRQHEPVLLDDGSILLFDNWGAAGRARILEIDPLTGELLWDYRGPEARPLYSPEAGTCQRLPNGNTLITESVIGRAFEITPDGTIVWEFVSPHRAGENREFVALLFEVVRLAPEAADFLRAGGHNT